MPKRITATVTVAALLAALAVAADAAVRRGDYKGQTRQDARVSFRVLNKKQLVRYFLQGAVLGCSRGRNLQLEGFTTSSRERIPINARGKFAFSADNDDESVAADVSGTIRTARATGTIRMVATINDQRDLDPDGGITCNSGSVSWTAKKR